MLTGYSVKLQCVLSYRVVSIFSLFFWLIVLQLTVPQGGIPAGKAFGFGDLLYLGMEWTQTIGGTTTAFDMNTNGDQLFLYCTNSNDNPNVIAALSTTGQAFVTLPDSLQHGYGVMVLPFNDGMTSSAKWRYIGPAYTKHDMYAKALIDVTNWRAVSASDQEMPPPSVASEVGTDDDKQQQSSAVEFHDESGGGSNGGEGDLVILPPRQQSSAPVTRTLSVWSATFAATVSMMLWLP